MARRGGKRGTKKPTMAKAKRMVTKQRKVKAKKNMDTYFLKTKTLSNVVPIQAILPGVSNYVYLAYNLDPTSSSAQYLSNAEFNLWRLQYDKFRVNTVRIHVKPKANVFDQANAQNDASLNVTGDGLIHTAVDRDSNAPNSIALMSRYPSYKAYSVMKPFTRSYSVKYAPGIWIDCDSPATFELGKAMGLGGGITIYAENVLEENYEIFNEPWAEITIEYNIVFQGKTSNSLKGVYDDEGNLSGVTIQKIPDTSVLPFSPSVNVRGSLNNDTRTLNEATEQDIDDTGVAK